MKPLRFGPALLGVALLVGCEIPTEAPMVEQRWIIPLDATSISVEELLPDGVGVAGDLFAVTIDPFKAEGTLGELCAACPAGPGPVPAFEGALVASQAFPTDVRGAALEGGAVAVAVFNGFSFDPTDGGGSVVITLSDGPGGKVLGTATISTGLPAGSTVTRGITLAGGPASPTLYATTVVTSVGGQSSPIDGSQVLTVSFDPTSVLAGFVTVNVAGRSVELEAAELDVSGFDGTISDHIQSGTLTLDITNPFGVEVTVDLVIDYPGGTLVRTVDIAGTAVSTTSVSYTGDEFRAFMGKVGVTLTGTGSVSSAAGPITVRTDQDLVLEATIDLTLLLG